MSLTGFALAAIAVVALLASPALSSAWRHGWPVTVLAALPFAPAAALLVALLAFNSEAKFGLGFLIYPLISGALGLGVLYSLVFVFKHAARSTGHVVGTLVVACAAAFLFGAFAAPWYE